MKKKMLSMFAVAMALAGLAMQSCSDNDDDVAYMPSALPNAIVTVKPVENKDSFYMQLDDSTILKPVNMGRSPYGDKEVRAFVNYDIVGQQYGKGQAFVTVNWIDSILTKSTSPDLGSENTVEYGQDPVEIMRDWTVSEDGYLTIHFQTWWGGSQPHAVRLVATSGSNPYELTFFHDANGDQKSYVASGIVAFRLDSLPDTGGKTVDLTLKWKSFSGDKSVSFKYRTRQHSSQSAKGMPFVKYENSLQ